VLGVKFTMGSHSSIMRLSIYYYLNVCGQPMISSLSPSMLSKLPPIISQLPEGRTYREQLYKIQ
jgi:hypothetical protein